MPSLRSHAIATAATLLRLRDRQFDPARFDVASPPDPAKYEPPRSLARTVSIDRREFEGWPTFILTAPGGSRANGVGSRSDTGSGQVLFLHGGAHAAEIQPVHWTFAAKLAARTGRTVTVPIYPLVPAATHRDVQPVLRLLYTEAAASGPVTVMGDSAGAALALTLAANLPADTPRPDHLVLLSPSLDLTFGNPRIPEFAGRDPLLRVDHLRELGRRYAGPDAPDHPEVSPLLGRLDNLGAVTVFTGTRDLLNPDAHRLRDLAATEPGTTVVLHQYPDMIHDWMLMPMPEAAQVMDQVAALLSSTARRRV